MPLVGFEPTISAGERPKTYALDRAATETGNFLYCEVILFDNVVHVVHVVRVVHVVHVVTNWHVMKRPLTH